MVNDDNLTIVTSFYPIYITTLNVTKGMPNVKVINLTKPQRGCLHDYQLSPADVKCLASAQVFVVNGIGMETFMDDVVKQQPDLKIAAASQGIPLIKGSGNDEYNPHVWVSISNAIQQVNNISEQLALLDPAHASQYRNNAIAYTARLNVLRQQMHKELDQLPNRNIVTFHEAFPYFAREFNLNIVGVIEREPGSEPSASDLVDIIELVKKSKVKTLFVEPQYSTKAADSIARETGARVFTLDPVVTGPMNPDAYLNIMKSNLTSLKEALQ